MTRPAHHTASPVWHPFTQHGTAAAPVKIASASGAFVTTSDGARLFDAIASWWVITHGHCHPRIADAIKAQVDTLDQVIFAGYTHSAAEDVAHALIEITPPELTRVFFSDSGATAVEVALKMALGYWRNRGQPRSRILAFENAYHGDTAATMSAGARGVFNHAYEPMMFEVARVPLPIEAALQTTLDAVDAACRAEPVAAMLIEPLILGAGGMLTYPASAIADIKAVLDRHDVLLIADEVMTGWGRTGTLFAMQQTGVTPDILCLAKGLTGGTLPLAVTLATDAIFDAHFSDDRRKTLFHSSSYTANPICCAAARANLEIWKTEPIQARLDTLVATQAKLSARFKNDPRFTGQRQCGTITACDVAVGDAGYLADIGPKMAAFALANGVLLRPLGNTIYTMPPYAATADELAHVYDVIDAAVDRAKKTK